MTASLIYSPPKLGGVAVRLLGKPKLEDLIARYPAAKPWVRGWVSEIGHATWKQPADLRQQFPRALETAPGIFAFPVAETSMALVLSIAFPRGLALIKHFVNQDHPHGR